MSALSKYYWKMVVKRGEVEKILEELEQAKKTIYECYSKLWEFDSGRGAETAGRCLRPRGRTELSDPAQRRLRQVQLHRLDGLPAGIVAQPGEQARVQ